jgi:hypothetical protein
MERRLKKPVTIFEPTGTMPYIYQKAGFKPLFKGSKHLFHVFAVSDGNVIDRQIERNARDNWIIANTAPGCRNEQIGLD